MLEYANGLVHCSFVQDFYIKGIIYYFFKIQYTNHHYLVREPKGQRMKLQLISSYHFFFNCKLLF